MISFVLYFIVVYMGTLKAEKLDFMKYKNKGNTLKAVLIEETKDDRVFVDVFLFEKTFGRAGGQEGRTESRHQ